MKYKKLIIFIILVLLTIPICLYIAGIVHFVITNQFTSISNMKFNIILDSVINDKQCQKLYFLTQALITLFLLFIAFIQKENIYASSLVNITDNIRTPVVVGQGQYGTARWLKSKEFETTFKKNVLDLKKNIKNQDFSLAGLVVGYKKLKKGKEEIYCVDTDTHSLTVRCHEKR